MGVADDDMGQVVPQPEVQGDALDVGLRPHHLHLRLDHLADVERPLFEREPAGLVLGVVENVVDDAEQRFPRVADLADMLILPVCQCAALKQVAKPQNGVHGRADLVAHIGKEQALGLVRGLRLLPALRQPVIRDAEFRVKLPDPVETEDDHADQPHKNAGLECDDGGMKQHARQMRIARKHQARQQNQQKEMMQPGDQSRRERGALIEPGDGQGEHGEEIHVPVHLPGMAVQQREDHRRLRHQRHGGEIARRRRDPVAVPGQVIGPRDEDARPQSLNQRTPGHLCDHRQKRHMRPEERNEKPSETATEGIEFLVHFVSSDVKQPAGRGAGRTSQAPAFRAASGKDGEAEPAMMRLPTPPSSISAPPDSPTMRRTSPRPAQGGPKTTYCPGTPGHREAAASAGRPRAASSIAGLMSRREKG